LLKHKSLACQTLSSATQASLRRFIMFNSLKKVLGIAKPQRKRVKLPEGLEHLEVIPAKAWWS
ncbi:hypothetical protein, partial [Shewanella sp. 10N.286.52.A9]